jgi:hypothetical protein
MTNLFDFATQVAPRARHTDRETSHAAAQAHAGKAVTNTLAVLRAVADNPDRTYKELTALALFRLDAVEVQRRLSDLKGQGFVYLSGVRARCATYRITETGADALNGGN